MNTPIVTRPRFPEMTGGLNFRDMGGYVSNDGRRVKWNKLYRSGTTHTLTDADLERLARLGIRYAYDLRSNAERQRHPNRLSAIHSLEYRSLDHDHIPGNLTRALREAQTQPGHARNMMIALYQKLPYDFRDAYRGLFDHLVQDDLPLVFNCTAGKDRTGVAAALILTALGVSREAVMEDYLLTAQCFERSCEVILQGRGAQLFEGIDRAVWEPVMRVDSAYLDAMFERLNATHSRIDGYLTEDLGLSAPLLERLKVNLLE